MNIKRWAIGLIGGVIALVAIYGSTIIYLTWPITNISVNNSGVFGDSFGLLTSLFSGLAFSGLILTILLQREDLNLQRQELSETRKEMKFQNFETTFFQMLRLHNDIVESIDIRKRSGEKTQISTGRDCFTLFHKSLRGLYSTEKGKSPQLLSLEIIITIYENFWNHYKQDLGHYFRYLYRIFKYVDESFVNDEQKKLYSSIVRAQLSDMETALLFYNCLSVYGSEKFKPLAEKYCLFDNLPHDLLFEENHVDLYKTGAFQHE